METHLVREIAARTDNFFDASGHIQDLRGTVLALYQQVAALRAQASGRVQGAQHEADHPLGLQCSWLMCIILVQMGCERRLAMVAAVLLGCSGCSWGMCLVTARQGAPGMCMLAHQCHFSNCTCMCPIAWQISQLEKESGGAVLASQRLQQQRANVLATLDTLKVGQAGVWGVGKGKAGEQVISGCKCAGPRHCRLAVEHMHHREHLRRFCASCRVSASCLACCCIKARTVLQAAAMFILSKFRIYRHMYCTFTGDGGGGAGAGGTARAAAPGCRRRRRGCRLCGRY